MAHLVESMAYVGQTPWHGLGNQLPSQQPLEVWAQQAGLDWEIKSSPVRFVNANNQHLGEILTFEGQNVLYRSDTNMPLSVVSDRYKIVQPQEVLEFYRDLTEYAGFELETAGVLKEGRKIWALAKTGQTGVVKRNDRTNAYVLLATACDGTMATTAQFTSVRVVCNNTLAVALNGATQTVKVPHSTVFDADAVKRELGISVSAWSGFMDSLKVLADRNVKSKEVENFFRHVFTDPTGNALKSNEAAMKKSLELFNGAGMGSDLSSSKGTAYGLVNAVTEYIDHHRRARSTDNRLDSAWFGNGADIKQRALDTALLLVA